MKRQDIRKADEIDRKINKNVYDFILWRILLMNKPLKFKDIQVNQYYWDNYNNEYVFINKKSKKGSKPKLVYVFADTAREYKEDRFYIKKKGS